MLHLSAQGEASRNPRRAHPEPVTRLASLRNALRVVNDFGGGPASDLDDELSDSWEQAKPAAKRCFDRRSAELVAAASEGMQALSVQRERGLDASVAAMRVIAEELRSGLSELARILKR